MSDIDVYSFYYIFDLNDNRILLKIKSTLPVIRASKNAIVTSETKCDVVMPWATDYPSLLGMAVPKKSIYYEMLRYQTLRQIETGAFKVIAPNLEFTFATNFGVDKRSETILLIKIVCMKLLLNRI